MNTIEEKAKAYNEALERARAMHDVNYTDSYTKANLETIFPELRESEDERMMRVISLALTDVPEERFTSLGTTLKDCLAYLEKQEQKPDVHQINMTIHPGPNIPSCPDPVIAEVKELESNDKYIKRNSKELGSLLTQYYDEGFWKGRKAERESQKPTPDWMPKFLDELRSKKNYFDWDEHRDIEGHILAIINWIAPNYFDRKKKEQKPIEFKNDELVEIIKGEFEGFRQLLKKKGIDYEPQRGYWEGFARLFDSSAREYVKEQKERNVVEVSGEYKKGFECGKQRVLKYPEEFNLQHVEQKPVDYEAELKKCKDNPLYFYDKYVSIKQKPSEKQDYSGLSDFERAIHRGFLSAGVVNVPVTIIKETAKECMAKNKPAEWSVEDETRLTNILIMLKEYVIHHYSKDDVNKSVDWLENRFRSLRPQSKQEWSEEDEKIAYTILNLLCSQVTYITGQGTTSGKQYPTYAKERDWFEKRFKSLRPQPKKSGIVLTEEQEKEFGHLFSYPHWKPSEEQMEALHKAIKKAYHDYDVRPLESLYTDLLKLK